MWYLPSTEVQCSQNGRIDIRQALISSLHQRLTEKLELESYTICVLRNKCPSLQNDGKWYNGQENNMAKNVTEY